MRKDDPSYPDGYYNDDKYEGEIEEGGNLTEMELGQRVMVQHTLVNGQMDVEKV